MSLFDTITKIMLTILFVLGVVSLILYAIYLFKGGDPVPLFGGKKCQIEKEDIRAVSLSVERLNFITRTGKEGMLPTKASEIQIKEFQEFDPSKLSKAIKAFFESKPNATILDIKYSSFLDNARGFAKEIHTAFIFYTEN